MARRPSAIGSGSPAGRGCGGYGCRSPAWPSGLLFGPWGWAAWLIYPLQVLRQTVRNPRPLADRATLALFQVLARFPEGLGQIKFTRDRLLGRQARLIEYK